jgi:multidrug efflux pump subunit AcrB
MKGSLRTDVLMHARGAFWETFIENQRTPVHMHLRRSVSDRRHRWRLSSDLPSAVVPLMLFIMATILMVQLQSFHKLFLVFAVAPLALIGVVSALLPSGAPLGFVAILGVLALIGILIRNSVILIVQIGELEKEGRAPAA